MASVSRALRDMPEISEETKQYVRDVAAQLGYHPNVFAATLRTGKSRFIGIIIPQNTNPYFADVIADIIAVVIEHGYIPVVLNSLESKALEREAVSAMVSFCVAGLLTIPVSLKNYSNLPFPVVILARQFEEKELDQFDYIINDERGMELSVRYLATKYKKIYYIAGRQDMRVAKQRRIAFEAAMVKYGLEIDENTVVYSDTNNMEAGYQAARTVIQYNVFPCAIQCMSDHMALGVMKAIRDSHLKLPQNVAVIGHDDIAYCEYSTVPLSSIRLSQKLGKVAADFLIRKIVDRDEQMKVRVRPELMIRESAKWD